MNSKYFYNKKAISPLIATVLIVLISVVLIGGVVSFSKDFTTSNLDESSVIKYDSTLLDGFIESVSVFEDISGNPSKVVLKNTSLKKDLNIISYKIIDPDAHNVNFVDVDYTLNEPLFIEKGSSDQLDIICLPSKEFVLEINTTTGEYIKIPVTYLGASLSSCDNAPYCGDGTCNGDETEETCYDDCHVVYFSSTWDTNNTSITSIYNSSTSTFVETASSSNNNQVELPLVENGNYNFTVNWGDGSSSEITSWDDSDKLHTYSSIGEYDIDINGTIEGWSFADYNFSTINPSDGDVCLESDIYLSRDRLKITNISNWGPLKLDSTDSNSFGHFAGCENLTITAEDSLNILDNTKYLTTSFADCFSLTDVPNIESWDTSNIIDLSNAFGRTRYSLALEFPDQAGRNPYVTPFDYSTAQKVPFNEDISSWDTSSVEFMKYTFFLSDFNQNIGNWNMENVTTIGNMFVGSSFDQDIGDWNIPVLFCSFLLFSSENYTLSTQMSVDNYSNSLIGWANNSNTGSNNYIEYVNQYHNCDSHDSFNYLVDTLSWDLVDLGVDPSSVVCGDGLCEECYETNANCPEDCPR